MVFDHISNAHLYSFTNPLLMRGLRFLIEREPASLAAGRIELDGDRLFVLVQEYSTRGEADCFWEAHRKYIDIQFLVSGVETIGYWPVDRLEVVQPYDAGKDMMKLAGTGVDLSFGPGSFAVFFPHDGHRPCVAAEGRSSVVRKVVVKVEARDE